VRVFECICACMYVNVCVCVCVCVRVCVCVCVRGYTCLYDCKRVCVYALGAGGPLAATITRSAAVITRSCSCISGLITSRKRRVEPSLRIVRSQRGRVTCLY
jgi:hypothetical protein